MKTLPAWRERYRAACDPVWADHLDRIPAMPLKDALEAYEHVLRGAEKAEVAYLGAIDRYFLLLHVLGRVDFLRHGEKGNRWLYDRVREVEREPDGFIDLWSREHYKLQALDEPTPTPTGWRKHGDLVPGDEIFGPDGGVCRVVALNEIVTDAECYEIEFDDGFKIKAGGEHLWPVERRTRKRVPGTFKAGVSAGKRIYRETTLMRTDEIAACEHATDRRLALRVNDPLDLPERNLPVDPYVLGCWLGDGNSAAPRLICSKEDWPHFQQHMEAAGHEVRVFSERRNAIAYTLDPRDTNICVRGHDRRAVGIYRHQCRECRRQAVREKQTGKPADPYALQNFAWLLRRLNLLADVAGKRKGAQKHIPPEYLRASPEQRLALLQGLMDSDGHCNTRGTATFANTNDRLVDDFCELAHTLGLKPRRRRHEGKYKGEAYPYWQVSFQAYRDMPPFRLKRKLERCKGGKRKNPRRYIVACRRLPSEPMRCIQVDREDGLYLTGRAMVPTHNSSCLTFGGSIQEIIRDPEITIGIFSFNRPTAKTFLVQIKRELETNTWLPKLYPGIFFAEPKTESTRWSEDGGILVKRQGNPKESTVEAWGLIDGQPTGRHFALRIYDDVVTRESVTTPDQIKKVTENRELSDNLGTKGGREWNIGTRYHFGDTYASLLERGIFKPRIYPATKDGTLNGEPVFLSQEEWDDKKRKQPSQVAAQMLQNPLAGEDKMFRAAWLQPYWVRPHTLHVYILGDPSKGSPNRRTDRTGMAVIGLDAAGNKYLLDGFRHRMPLTERWKALKGLHKKWSNVPGVQLVQVGYERYGMMSDLEHFEEMMRLEKYHFAIEEVAWTRDHAESKEDRVERLVPDLAEGRFYIPALVWRDGSIREWQLDESGERVSFQKEFVGPEKRQQRVRDMAQPYRVAEPIKRIDEQRQVYDLTAAFIEEALYFPFGTHDDLIDAVSRIYDMEPVVPQIVDEALLEPEVFCDT